MIKCPWVLVSVPKNKKIRSRSVRVRDVRMKYRLALKEEATEEGMQVVAQS